MICAPKRVTKTDSFFSKVAAADCRLLLLDYDGTLAPFHHNRYRAFPYDGIVELLDIIMGLDRVRVVLVSGRRAAELPPLLGAAQVPEIWGSYGMERLLPDGTYHTQPLDDIAYEIQAQAAALLAEEDLAEQTEIKPGVVAVHWRGLSPEAIREVEAKVGRVHSALRLAPSALVRFDGGIEIRLSSCNKGDAVRHLLSELQTSAAIAYLGDDVSDEDAFRALKGRAMRVLVRPEYRPTAADLWLRPPEEVVGFLRMWMTACGGMA